MPLGRCKWLGNSWKPFLDLCVFTLQVDLQPMVACVLPCAIGEVAKDHGTRCERCDHRLFSLWSDPRAGGMQAARQCSYMKGSDAWDDLASYPTCEPCPFNANCTGGAVLVPLEGFWHSAPNSTIMHACPMPEACRAGKADAQDALVACQELWYASRVPGELASAAMNNFSRPLGTANASACALWGYAQDHQLSYMQRQCKEPYTGNLCGTCRPGYTISPEFECT